MIGRRGFITGLVSLVAAPAIVWAGSLMPVRAMIEPYGVGPISEGLTIQKIIDMKRVWRLANTDLMVFGTSAVFVSNDGEFRHVPVGEIYR